VVANLRQSVTTGPLPVGSALVCILLLNVLAATHATGATIVRKHAWCVPRRWASTAIILRQRSRLLAHCLRLADNAARCALGLRARVRTVLPFTTHNRAQQRCSFLCCIDVGVKGSFEFLAVLNC
jgi:hypothetical protein